MSPRCGPSPTPWPRAGTASSLLPAKAVPRTGAEWRLSAPAQQEESWEVRVAGWDVPTWQEKWAQEVVSHTAAKGLTCGFSTSLKFLQRLVTQELLGVVLQTRSWTAPLIPQGRAVHFSGSSLFIFGTLASWLTSPGVRTPSPCPDRQVMASPCKAPRLSRTAPEKALRAYNPPYLYLFFTISLLDIKNVKCPGCTQGWVLPDQTATANTLELIWCLHSSKPLYILTHLIHPTASEAGTTNMPRLQKRRYKCGKKL